MVGMRSRGSGERVSGRERSKRAMRLWVPVRKWVPGWGQRRERIGRWASVSGLMRVNVARGLLEGWDFSSSGKRWWRWMGWSVGAVRRVWVCGWAREK